jgi:hypothetical protein
MKKTPYHLFDSKQETFRKIFFIKTNKILSPNIKLTDSVKAYLYMVSHVEGSLVKRIRGNTKGLNKVGTLTHLE